jgi:hypothetical protein
MHVIVVVIVLAALAEIALEQVSRRHPLFGAWWYGSWAVICGALFGYDIAAGYWGWVPVMAASALINAWNCWRHWNRRKRRRAPRALGAKSRARIAALVRKARETARPRRVLRPVPGGAP